VDGVSHFIRASGFRSLQYRSAGIGVVHRAHQNGYFGHVVHQGEEERVIEIEGGRGRPGDDHGGGRGGLGTLLVQLHAGLVHDARHHQGTVCDPRQVGVGEHLS